MLILLCSLSACTQEAYEAGYEDGYSDGCSDAEIEMQSILEEEFLDGYDWGYDEGYFEGIADAQHSIAIRVDDDLWSLSFDIKEKYGMHPEDAVTILTNYADDPEAIDVYELEKAIWAIRRYYYDSHKVIHGIEDYSID